ncbi:hypothetical protein [Thermococcus sp.]
MGNTTISIPEKPYYVVDDLTINVSSTCPQWVFLTFYGPEESKVGSFFANGSEMLNLYNLSPKIFSLGWKNVTILVTSRCPLNISILPKYYPDVCGEEYYVSSWRYRIVTMPLRRTEIGTYELRSPLKVEAVYFLTDRPYLNGTPVSEFPLNAEVTMNGRKFTIEAIAVGNGRWWFPISSPESGNLRVVLSGEAAGRISRAYALALFPQEYELPGIPSYGDGYLPPHCRPVGYLKMSGEAFWDGENFTLLKYMTDDGRKNEIYVKNGFVCARVGGGEGCSGPLIPGPSHFEVLFSNGVLVMRQWDRNLLTLETGSKGIVPELFLGLPSEKLYGMEIYAKNPVPWNEKKRNWTLALGVLIIAAGILAVVGISRH